MDVSTSMGTATASSLSAEGWMGVASLSSSFGITVGGFARGGAMAMAAAATGGIFFSLGGLTLTLALTLATAGKTGAGKAAVKVDAVLSWTRREAAVAATVEEACPGAMEGLVPVTPFRDPVTKGC